MEWRQNGFTISDERAKVKIDTVAHLLAGTHWGYRRPRQVVEKLVENSLCFSLFRNTKQVGFARWSRIIPSFPGFQTSFYLRNCGAGGWGEGPQRHSR